MIISLPGTVTVYIPYQLLTPFSVPTPDLWSLAPYGAIVVLVIGAAILFKSIWSFAYVGRGARAPFYEANKLIVIGLYRYVRNPMYVGVMMTLLAESWFFWSSRLLIYTGVCFVVANLLVIGNEEKRLRYKYSDEYLRYCENVRRWIPGKPYDHAG